MSDLDRAVVFLLERLHWMCYLNLWMIRYVVCRISTFMGGVCCGNRLHRHSQWSVIAWPALLIRSMALLLVCSRYTLSSLSHIGRTNSSCGVQSVRFSPQQSKRWQSPHQMHPSNPSMMIQRTMPMPPSLTSRVFVLPSCMHDRIEGLVDVPGFDIFGKKVRM